MCQVEFQWNSLSMPPGVQSPGSLERRNNNFCEACHHRLHKGQCHWEHWIGTRNPAWRTRDDSNPHLKEKYSLWGSGFPPRWVTRDTGRGRERPRSKPEPLELMSETTSHRFCYLWLVTQTDLGTVWEGATCGCKSQEVGISGCHLGEWLPHCGSCHHDSLLLTCYGNIHALNGTFKKEKRRVLHLRDGVPRHEIYAFQYLLSLRLTVQATETLWLF